MNENEDAMSCVVESFLHSIGLHKYSSAFFAKGYDRETDLQHLSDADMDVMMIADPAHRRTLITAARKHTVSEEGKLLSWLRQHELEHYFIGFVRSELVDMEEVARLNLPDENIYDELEISMPGHQRRLERAVRQLNKKQKLAENAEMPVTEGFWGKPTNLEDAKYDFLCVEATISSTKDASRSHKIDFMVDSGSDVTTLQEDLLHLLNPELIGPINSKGVHSSKRKYLYKAQLTLGNQSLEIEVMGEAYNSLGSRVLRHFRHYITGSKHIWLPGDYFDPTMSTSLKQTACKLASENSGGDSVVPTNIHSASDQEGNTETVSKDVLQDSQSGDTMSNKEDHSAVVSLDDSTENTDCVESQPPVKKFKCDDSANSEPLQETDCIDELSESEDFIDGVMCSNGHTQHGEKGDS